MRRRAPHRIPLAALLLAALALFAAACGGPANDAAEVADVEIATEPASAGNDEPAAASSPAASGATASATAGGPASAADAEQGMLDYTRCMREHGVDLADPKPVEGDSEGAFVAAPLDVDPKKMQAADEDCRKHLEAFLQEPTPEQEEQIREQGVAMARCMRDAGIDMPDPVIGEGAALQQVLPDGVDPNSRRFRKALERCSKAAGGGAVVVGSSG